MTHEIFLCLNLYTVSQYLFFFANVVLKITFFTTFYFAMCLLKITLCCVQCKIKTGFNKRFWKKLKKQLSKNSIRHDI